MGAARSRKQTDTPVALACMADLCASLHGVLDEGKELAVKLMGEDIAKVPLSIARQVATRSLS